MRLLILLSAMLTALCGVVSGAASAASGIEASVSIGAHVERRTAALAARFVDEAAPVARPVPGWHVAATVAPAQIRALYGDRRRE